MGDERAGRLFDVCSTRRAARRPLSSTGRNMQATRMVGSSYKLNSPGRLRGPGPRHQARRIVVTQGELDFGFHSLSPLPRRLRGRSCATDVEDASPHPLRSPSPAKAKQIELMNADIAVRPSVFEEV